MVSKTISVTLEVYDLLKREKFASESFSDTIRRLVARRGKLSDCAGLWEDMGVEEEQEILDAIHEVRANATQSMLERVNEL